MSIPSLIRSWPVAMSLVVVGAVSLSGGAAPFEETGKAGRSSDSATQPDRLSRLRIDTPDGALLFFEAGVPGEIVRDSGRFLAWWRDEQTSRIYLFSMSVHSFRDARSAAAALSG